MVQSKQMPSVAEFRAMQEHLTFKEREREKSKATADSLNQGTLEPNFERYDEQLLKYLCTGTDFSQLTKDLLNVQEVSCVE
jgi:hypothetical protein